ncbi:MAG: hypothetical protein ABR576_16765 [Thermoanaerobaculia bacterium]
MPTPPTGTLRIAPDIVAEGSRRVRLIIAGSGFDAGTTVSTPADIRLEILRPRAAAAFNDSEVPRLTPWTTVPADRLLAADAPFARGF